MWNLKSSVNKVERWENIELAAYKLLVYSITPEEENIAVETINAVSSGYEARTIEAIRKDPRYVQAALEAEEAR